MEFKCVLFTDLHLGVHNNNEIWLNSSIYAIKEIIQVAKNNNIENVIFLGDFFHNRQSINSKTLWIANEIADLFENNKIRLWLLVGNHDTYLKNSLKPHSLRMFNNYEYIEVIDEIYSINELITLIPWGLDKKKAKTPYILGHFEINGCEVGENFTESNAEFKISDFKNYNLVLSGHYHTPSFNQNIFYIGSIMPFTFYDVDSKRGYYIFNFNEKKADFQFIEFNDCPKYKIIFSDSELKENEIKGNVVKLIYKNELSSIESEDLLSKIQKMKPVMLYSDFKNIVSSNDDTIQLNNANDVIKSSKDLLFDYINLIKKPKHINEKTLKSMIKSILN